MTTVYEYYQDNLARWLLKTQEKVHCPVSWTTVSDWNFTFLPITFKLVKLIIAKSFRDLRAFSSLLWRDGTGMLFVSYTEYAFGLVLLLFQWKIL